MKRLVIAVTCISLVGCATQGITHQPVVDLSTSQHPDNYNKDLYDCRGLVRTEHSTNAGQSALLGAVFGALVGAAFGDRKFAAQGAAVGGLSAGASGLNRSVEDEKSALNNCLRSRGYSVLR